MIWLWQGRCHDLLGQWANAEELYRRVILHTPLGSKLEVLAGKGLKRPYRRSALKSVVPEFLMGESEEV